MERRPLTLAHAALSAWAAASVAAFGLAHGPWALVFLPGIAASGFWTLQRLPMKGQLALRWAGWTGSVAVAALPLLVNFQGLTIETATRIAAPSGSVLCLLATLFLFSAPAWTPGRTVIPASIALLGAAGLRRETPILLALFALAGLAALLHLGARRRIRLVPIAVFGGLGGATAVGLCLLLPWAQPWVEGKAAELIVPGIQARAGLSLTSRLGEIEELALSPTVVMRVWTERPQYLRARVYTQFNGRVWNVSSSGERRRLVASGPDFAVPGASTSPPLVRSKIVREPTTLPVILAPAQTVLVRYDGPPGWVDDGGVLSPAGAAPEAYEVLNRRDHDRSPPANDCLDASAVADPRLRALAETLKAGADPAERVRRTADHLESTCTYSLKVGAFQSTDPVSEFVFDKRRGYCEYFASAMALLLRMEGVPSRYVVGYSVRPSNLEGGPYVVREADAHAWVEAYLPERGWVEIDPTPAAQFEAMRAPIRGGFFAGLWERLKSLGRGIPLAGAGVLAVLGWLIFRLRGRWTGWLLPRRTKAAAADDGGVPLELQDLMKRLDAAWKRSGHPRPATRAPLEHLRGLPEAAKVGVELVEVFYRCRYGGTAPARDDLEGLGRGL